MQTINIIDIKKILFEKLVKNCYNDGSDENNFNELCDNIISAYIAYSLYRINTNKSFEEFIIFIDKNSFTKKILPFLDNNLHIYDVLLNLDLSFLDNPYFLAETYELLKSYIIDNNDKTTIKNKNLSYRKLNGIYYTPEDIVKYIVDNTLKNKFDEILNLIKIDKASEGIKLLLDIKIIDIACGTGSFLIEVINQMDKLRIKILDIVNSNEIQTSKNYHILKNKTTFIRHVISNSIYGVDIDPNSALICSYNIHKSLLKINNKQDLVLFGRNILVGNSLTGKISPEDDYLESNGKNNINWYESFPDIFTKNNPGFDIIVMNPPYGKLRIESNKGHNKYNNTDAVDKQKMNSLSVYFRKSKNYKYSTYGVLNIYKLMIERSLDLVRKGGTIGFIVPNTLLCDISCNYLRKYIFENTTINQIIEIPEKSDFFEEVTQAFCIFILSFEDKTIKFKFKGNVKNKNDLKNNQLKSVNADFIREKFHNSYYIPITDKKGLDIFSKIHSGKKIIDFPEIKNKRGEVDISFYSELIKSNKNKSNYLIRGRNIDLYNLNFNDYNTSTIDYEELVIKMNNSSKLEDIQKERIVGRQISNLNSDKRLIFTIAKKRSIVSNSCNYLTVDKNSSICLRYLLAFLNSSLIEWRFRITSTNNHVNNYEINDFPFILPTIEEDNYVFVKEIEKLTIQIEKTEDLKEVNLLLAKIDSYIFKLFNLKAQEIEYILSSLNKR